VQVRCAFIFSNPPRWRLHTCEHTRTRTGASAYQEPCQLFTCSKMDQDNPPILGRFAHNRRSHSLACTRMQKSPRRLGGLVGPHKGIGVLSTPAHVRGKVRSCPTTWAAWAGTWAGVGACATRWAKPPRLPQKHTSATIPAHVGGSGAGVVGLLLLERLAHHPRRVGDRARLAHLVDHKPTQAHGHRHRATLPATLPPAATRCEIGAPCMPRDRCWRGLHAFYV
jgi:hypothetical protein